MSFNRYFIFITTYFLEFPTIYFDIHPSHYSSQIHPLSPSHTTVSFSFDPSSSMCAAHILLDGWHSLEDNQPTRGQNIKENWFFFPQQLSVANSSLVKSRISCPLLLSMPGFSLAWETCSYMFTAALFTIAREWKHPDVHHLRKGSWKGGTVT